MFFAVLAGIIAGAFYTVSPLTAWCIALAAIVLTLAGRRLPSSERRTLNIVLVTALVVRLSCIGALVVINAPMHDDESVGMLSGDEAYGLSRALRTRDVVTGVPVTQYDHFVVNDEYGRNSYVALLTGIQILFGPTPYSMRLLNTLLFTIAAVLLFRAARSAFGPLPAFGGLIVMMFLPTLFLWSMSLLKEPLYLFGTTLVITGAIGAAHAKAAATTRAAAIATALVGLTLVSDLRPGAVALALLGLGCGVAGLAFFSSSLRVKAGVAIVAVLVLFAITWQPSARQRITA